MKNIIALVLTLVSIQAAPVYLGWDPSPDIVTGYRVHVGFVSGVYHTNYVVGTNAALIDGQLTVTNTIQVLGGQTVFLAVSAIGANGLESILSDEISHGVAPRKPVKFRIWAAIGADGRVQLFTTPRDWDEMPSAALARYLYGIAFEQVVETPMQFAGVGYE